MHYDASLRVRVLTQNIYDIGDEIAEHIDNLGEAFADWDIELAEDCLVELDEIIAEGRSEVRPELAELNGLRQAFVSGVRAGEMSNTFAHPGRTLSFLHKNAPTPPKDIDGEDRTSTNDAEDEQPRTTMASTATWRLWLREQNTTAQQKLEELAEWVVEQTDLALTSQAVLLPQAYSKAQRCAEDVAQQWREAMDKQPALVRSMRGEAPPQFLAERARIARVTAKLMKRRGQVV